MKKNIIIITIGIILLFIWTSYLNPMFFKKEANLCQKNFEIWTNDTYKFSMCLPNDWKSMNWYWKILAEFDDNAVEIWEPIINSNSFKTKIQIWSNNRLDIIDGYWYGVTDPFITKIEWNKLYVDTFERWEWNNLVYKGSLLYINSWSNIISFFYDKNNQDHKIIINSVEEK
jgi:hypothetical protein